MSKGIEFEFSRVRENLETVSQAMDADDPDRAIRQLIETIASLMVAIQASADRHAWRERVGRR